MEVSGLRVVALCKDILANSQKLAQCRVELTVLAVVVCGVSCLVRVLPLLVEGWISAPRNIMYRKPKLQTLVTRTT